MEVVDLRCRFIRDDEGRHSFQIFNSFTGAVLYSPPDWWMTRTEAEAQERNLRDRLLSDLRAHGMQITKGETSDVVCSHKSGPLTIIVALAVHRQSGQYGFVVATTDKRILITPEQYYTTPDEAFRAAKASYPRIAEALRAMNIGPFKLLEPDASDFNPDDADPPVHKQAAQQKPQQQPSQKPAWMPLQMPPGFNPSMN